MEGGTQYWKRTKYQESLEKGREGKAEGRVEKRRDGQGMETNKMEGKCGNSR